MGTRMRRPGVLGAALAVGIAGLGGCQHPGRPHAPHGATARPPLLGGEDRAPAITAAGQADVQVALGRAAEQRGDLVQATAAYREALARDKTRGDAAVRLAILHDRRGEFDRSAELYRRALAARPGDPEVFCDMGYSLYLQRRWAEAERNFRQAIALEPRLARAHVNLGLVLTHAGRLDDAADAFRRGGCDEAAARENVAFALSTEGRWDEARDQYRLAQRSGSPAGRADERLRELDHLAAAAGRRAAPPTRDGAVAAAAAPAPPRAAPVAPAPPRVVAAAAAPAPDPGPALPALPPAAPPRPRAERAGATLRLPRVEDAPAPLEVPGPPPAAAGAAPWDDGDGTARLSAPRRLGAPYASEPK